MPVDVASSSAPAEASTALAKAASTSLRDTRTNVPPGVRIRWFQRKEVLSIDIEVPDIEEADITWDDDGLIELHAKDPKQRCTLQLKHRVHTSKSRWWLSGRYVKLELAKAEYGRPHWDRLTCGDKLPNVLIDWTSWIDEAEETEVRHHLPRARETTATACEPALIAHPACCLSTCTCRCATTPMGTMQSTWRAPWGGTGVATSIVKPRRKSRPKRSTPRNRRTTRTLTTSSP